MKRDYRCCETWKTSSSLPWLYEYIVICHTREQGIIWTSSFSQVSRQCKIKKILVTNGSFVSGQFTVLGTMYFGPMCYWFQEEMLHFVGAKHRLIQRKKFLVSANQDLKLSLLLNESSYFLSLWYGNLAFYLFEGFNIRYLVNYKFCTCPYVDRKHKHLYEVTLKICILHTLEGVWLHSIFPEGISK